MELFKYFKIEVIAGSVKRVQMSDEEYFGPKYKDYVSNSKMGLLNPAQGGSPQKFFEGFKSNNSPALALGSAVHQLTLESNDYMLSNVQKPGGKLGAAYAEFVKLRKDGKSIEEAMVLACNKAEYYLNRLKSYKGNSVPDFMKEGMEKCYKHYFASKTKQINGKNVIYLATDQYPKCVGCVDSIKRNTRIQKELTVPLSYCEDVILCEVKVTFPKDFAKPLEEQVETIIKLKMKADQWNINHEEKWFTLNDVKTTGKPLQYFMGYEFEAETFAGKETIQKTGSFQNFHYSRQMA